MSDQPTRTHTPGDPTASRPEVNTATAGPSVDGGDSPPLSAPPGYELLDEIGSGTATSR
jgi:hypothetical protein